MKSKLLSFSILTALQLGSMPLVHASPHFPPFGGGIASDMGWTVSPEDGDTDSTSGTVTWVSKVPTIVSGKWVTFTGEGGEPLKDGKFSIEANGAFSTDSPVVLEVHYYDSVTGETGDLVTADADGPSTGLYVSSLEYTVGDVYFESEKGADVDSVVAILKQGEVPSSAVIVDSNVKYSYSDIGIKDKSQAGKTFWSISSGPADVFETRIPGDKITASALVTVDIGFTSYR